MATYDRVSTGGTTPGIKIPKPEEQNLGEKEGKQNFENHQNYITKITKIS